MRTTVLIAALLIVLIVLGFGWATYRKVSQAVNRETLAVAVQERAKVLVPQVAQKLSEAAQLAAPKYREVAFARLQEVGPELQAKTRASLEALPKDFEKQLTQRFEDVSVRLTKRLGDEIKRDFPALTGDQQEQLLNSLHDELKTHANQITGELESAMLREAERIQQILVKMDPGQLSAADRQKLEERLLHHLIMLADYYVTGEIDPQDVHESSVASVTTASAVPTAAPASDAPTTPAAAQE